MKGYISNKKPRFHRPRRLGLQLASIEADGSVWVEQMCVGHSPVLAVRYKEALANMPPGATLLGVNAYLYLNPPPSGFQRWHIAWVDQRTGEEGVTEHPTGFRDHVERTTARLNQVMPERLHWAITRER